MNKDNDSGVRSNKVKNMLCFIPFFSIIIFFIEKDKSERLTKNIYYSFTFLGLIIIFGLLTRFSIMFLLYILLSSYLAYKAYIGEDVDFKFLDDIFFKKK